MPPKKKRRAPPRAQSPQPQPQPEPEPEAQEPERSTSPSQNSDHEEDSRTTPAAAVDEDDDEPTPQLFNTTFSTYRVSPLHISSQEPLTASRLQILSRRLRDLVVGDVVRGVQVGGLSGGGIESDTTLGRAGALEGVEWRWVSVNRLLGGRRDRARMDDDDGNNREGSLELGSARVEPQEEERIRRRGRPGKDKGKGGRNAGAARKETERGDEEQKALCLEISYENSTFSAILLPDISPASPGNKEAADISRLPWMTSTTTTTIKGRKDDQQNHSPKFIHLPLLILKLPAPLKSVLIDFLSSTFDCRVSPLRLGTRTLVRCWEDWLAQHTRSGARHRRQQQHKDITLTLGFHLEPVVKDSSSARNGPETGETKETLPPSPSQPVGIKSLDIVIPAVEIIRFLRAGEEIATSQAAAAAAADRDNASRQKPTATKKRKLSDAFPLQDARGEEERLNTEPHRRLRRKLAGGREDEGWVWRQNSPNNGDNDRRRRQEQRQQQHQPFTEALASYLSSHLALDLFHPGVRVQRVACAGFVMAEAGRVRIARPRPTSSTVAPDPDDSNIDGGGGSEGVWNLVQELVFKAKGGGWSADAVRLAKLIAEGQKEGRKGGVG